MRRTLSGVEKGDLREQLRHASGPDEKTARAIVEGLFRWMSMRLPGTVSAFLAMSDEVDVGSLFERLPGWRWVLPRVETDGSLTFRDRDLPRELHLWGMEQPVGGGQSIPVHELDLLLVPGLAFDRTGRRLGRGGGYYDRLLAERRADCLAVGVTWLERVLDEVPIESHDRRVDMLATEAGVERC